MKNNLTYVLAMALLTFGLVLSAGANGRDFRTLSGKPQGSVPGHTGNRVKPLNTKPVGPIAGPPAAYRPGYKNYPNNKYHPAQYYANRYDEYWKNRYDNYSDNHYDDYYDNYHDYGLRYLPIPMGMPFGASQPAASEPRAKPEKKRFAIPVVDLQPGVDLIKVSIPNSNGLRTEVPILRIQDRFVGPQGEEYASLPTAETLAQLYGM